jgi:hypothetical protein
MNGTSGFDDGMQPFRFFPPCLSAPARANCNLDVAGTQPELCPPQKDQISLLEEVQERERQRIAMDLHDGLGP